MSVGAHAQPHDKISFSILRSPFNSERCATLYASGLSLQDVAKELGIAKSSVLGHLRRFGISLRAGVHSSSRQASETPKSYFGKSPYGYVVIRGSRVKDPKETEVVRRMLALWNSGSNFRAIAKALNALGIKTRSGGQWRHPTVSTIIRRELSLASPSKKRRRGKS